MQSQRQLVIIVQSAERRGDRQSEPASCANRPVEHLFEIDFGAKNVRSIPLPVARIRKIFSARSGDFHRKNFGADEKVAQFNRTSSK
jgi:hypothetical protein